MNQGSEHQKLDYKRALDISNNAELIEITKDIAAMLSSGGGAILIGADDQGKPVTDLTDAMVESLDEAKLRNKLKKYIQEPFDVAVSYAAINDVNHVLIECGSAYEGGFVVFQTIGQYQENGRDKVAFRQGEVFVRHGSASERWQQHDIKRIIESEISKRKNEWLKDAELILTRLDGGNGEKAIIHQLKSNTKDIKKHLKDNEFSFADLSRGIDDTVITAIKAVKDDNLAVFDAAIKSLVEFYKMGFDHRGLWRLDTNINPVDLWTYILARLPLIGGACIEDDKYQWAKELVLQSVPGDDARHYPNWYRHALTMGAREDRFSNGQERGSFLVHTTDLFRNDVRYKGLLSWGGDDGRDFIVSFDFFASIVALDEIQKIDDSAFYTSFSFYNKERILPSLTKIVLDSNLRKILFKSSDEHLAHIILTVDEYAAKDNFFHWDKGDWPHGLKQFIAKAESF